MIDRAALSFCSLISMLTSICSLGDIPTIHVSDQKKVTKKLNGIRCNFIRGNFFGFGLSSQRRVSFRAAQTAVGAVLEGGVSRFSGR